MGRAAGDDSRARLTACPKLQIAQGCVYGHALSVEPVVTRDEVVALLFNVSDMAVSLDSINRFLTEDEEGGEEEETDEG